MNYLLGITAVLAVVVPLLYICAVGFVQSSFPKLRNKRICLLIAHPDDEAMFFAPTVLALTRPETGNHVKILCLSTGDADGLGETRKKELVKSGMSLGLQDEDDIFVMDNPKDFPDSMTVTWDESKIGELLCKAFAARFDRHNPDENKRVTANIDVLITFDSQGVSSHPNHISLYHGARAFVAALVRAGGRSPVDLYTLGSVSLTRKYTSVADAIATLASSWSTVGKADAKHPTGLVFMNKLTGDEPGLRTAWKAMTEAHKSQMVWFRYLWIAFSRYMLINDLRLEEVEVEAT